MSEKTPRMFTVYFEGDPDGTTVGQLIGNGKWGNVKRFKDVLIKNTTDTLDEGFPAMRFQTLPDEMIGSPDGNFDQNGDDADYTMYEYVTVKAGESLVLSYVNTDRLFISWDSGAGGSWGEFTFIGTPE